jgi:hypothetical protein
MEAAGQTYTNDTSNPKAFLLPPGEYLVEVREIRGERRQIKVTVAEGEETVHMVGLAGGR